MAEKIQRTIQPAHKSDRITVEQAKQAWLKVEAEARNRRSVSERKPEPSVRPAGESG